MISSITIRYSQLSHPKLPFSDPDLVQVTLFFPQDATYLFAGGNSFVAAIDPSNGGLKWHQGFEQGFGRGPVTFAAHKHTTHHLDEKIYVGSKGKVKSLYARTGEKCWTKSLPDTGYEVVTLLTSADGTSSRTCLVVG